MLPFLPQSKARRQTNTDTWKPLSPCTREGLDAAIHEHPKLGVYVSHIGCPGCEAMKPELAKVNDKLPIREIPVENRGCDLLLDELKVDSTPTLFVYEGKSEPKRTIIGYEDDTPKELEALAAE